MPAEQPLFPPDLIPASAQAGLGDDLESHVLSLDALATAMQVMARREVMPKSEGAETDVSLAQASASRSLDLIRPLLPSDHKRGHLDVLKVLTVVQDLTPEQYEHTFRELASCQCVYHTIVIIHKPTDKVVGCGSVIVERKFVRGAGLVAHIEDIAVSKSMQGRKLGLRIIQTLTGIAERRGCYKVILDCSKDNIPFYEKCGFQHKEYEMVRYFDSPASKTAPAAKL